jgi:acetolactate synthase-1/2/3 large subunit
MLGFWGTPSANAVAREADLIIAIGTRFAETDSSSWVDGVTFSIPPTRLIHIDIDPSEIGRNYPTEQGYVADAERSLVAIAEAVAKFDPPTRDYDLASLATEVARFRSSGSENAKSNAFPLMPERILSDLYAVAGENITLVTDVGWNKNGVGQQYPISSTQGFLTPGGFSTMGFGPAAVLGVTLANPERKAVALVGDGAFSSVPQAVPTAVEMGIAPIWVVMNNSSFGTISGLQQKHYGSSYGCDFRTPEDEAYSPDFAAWARACGAEGRTVARPSDFAEYLQEALASNRPTVIDVPMTNTPVPTPGLWDIERIYERDSSRARP